MIIGILRFVLYFGCSGSLKEKRMRLEGLKRKLRSDFNISILEVDDVDKWQKSSLAIVNVAKDKRYANSVFSSIIKRIENNCNLQLLDYEMEFI